MSVGKKTPPEGVAASVFFCRTQSFIPRDTYCFAWAGPLPGKPSKGRIDMQLQWQTAAAASHKLPGAYIILLGGSIRWFSNDRFSENNQGNFRICCHNRHTKNKVSINRLRN